LRYRPNILRHQGRTPPYPEKYGALHGLERATAGSYNPTKFSEVSTVALPLRPVGRALLAVSKYVKGVAVGDVVVAPRAIYLIDKAVPHLDFVDARATIYAVFARAADQQV
jgi:hypothetical protein